MTVLNLAERSMTGTLAVAENGSGKRFRVKIIEAGQGSSAFYPERVLEDYASVFRKGTHSYLDHPTFSEDFERPERSVRDLVGATVTEAEYSEGALYAEMEFYPWAAPIIQEMSDDVGLSIRAIGTAEEGENGPVLTSFVEVLSVDVVTRAGAGGKIIKMLESAREKTAKDYTESAEHVEENVMNEEQQRLLESIAEGLNSLTTALAPVVEAHRQAEKPEEPQIDAVATAEALAKSGLSEGGITAVAEAVRGGFELDKAIERQKTYEESIATKARESAGYRKVDEADKDKSVKVTGWTKVGA